MPYLGNVPSSFNVGTNNIDNGAVTTEKIADGAVVNADVSASAAIAGTKISPDFGSQNLLTTGTATAASLIPTSSTAPTNGIYLSAANTLAISTNGSGRLFIDSSGNVLVNTSTSPTATIKLLVNGNAGVSSGSYLSFRGEFGNTTEPAAQAIKYDSGLTGLQYYGYGGHAYFAGGSERMRLDSSGRLGVGTSSPQGLIDARTDQVAATRIICNNASSTAGASTNFDYYFGTTRLGGVVHGFDATSAYFGIDVWNGSAATRRLTISAAGNVGIGTSSVSANLDLVGSTSTSANNTITDAAFRVRSNLSGTENFAIRHRGASAGISGLNSTCQLIGSGSNAIELYTVDATPVVFGTSATERMRLTSTGLGIGTSSPGALLDISGSGNIVRLGDGTNTFDVRFKGPNNWAVQLDTSADKFNIQKNSTPLVIVDGAGRVGIGTTPSYPLDVSASGTIGVRYKSTANYAAFIADTTSATGGGYFSAYQNGTQKALFGVTGGFLGDTSADCLIAAETGQHIRFFTNGSITEKARIDTSGRLLVGTSSARNNITQFSDPYLQIEGNYSRSISVLNNENNGNASGIALSKIRSTSVLNSGDIPGIITFGGYDGTQFREAANIQAVIDGTPGAGDMPGRLVFSTTADGASSPTERLRIANNGQLSAVVPGNSTLYPGFMARAWVNFNGTGTVNIRGSGNVSSITDNGVGDYYINYTTAMPDGNYSGITNNDWYGLGYLDSYNTTSVHLVTLDNNWTKRDINVLSVAIFR